MAPTDEGGGNLDGPPGKAETGVLGEAGLRLGFHLGALDGCLLHARELDLPPLLFVGPAIALLFLGIARARSGDADGALTLLHTVERAGWISHRDVWKAWLLPWLAQLHAARAELDLARKWLEVGRATLPADRREVLRLITAGDVFHPAA